MSKKPGLFDDMQDDIPPEPTRKDVDPAKEYAKKSARWRRENQKRIKRTQKNRHLLVYCSRCTFQFRTSRRNIDAMKRPAKCLAADCNGELQEMMGEL